MSAQAIEYAIRKFFCYLLGHDVRVHVPAKSLVNLWCERCGDALYTKNL